MKKLFALLLTLTMLFSLTSCDFLEDIGNLVSSEEGDSTEPSGNTDDTETTPSGNNNPVFGGYNGNYVFNPPTDNYYIALNDGAVEEVRVGDMYSYFENNEQGYSVHVNFSREGKVYVPYQGKWYNDTNMVYDDYTEIKESCPLIFRSMEDGLISYLKAFGTEDDEHGEKLKDYYVGNEKVCDVNCWVFDSKGINALYTKYRVDPSNGAVLKVEYYQSDYIEELSAYDVNYTKMDQKFYPDDYENVGIW